MKKIMKRLMKFSPVTVMNALALMMVIGNVNAACFWFMHQPEVPESAKKFIKE